jgi:hypothetical protein
MYVINEPNHRFSVRRLDLNHAGPVLWNRHGDIRLIPWEIILDTRNLLVDLTEQVRLNNLAEIPHGRCDIIWDQADAIQDIDFATAYPKQDDTGAQEGV